MTRLQLKLNKRSTIIWISILVSFIILFMAVFPSMASESMQKLVDAKLDELPAALLSIVGFDTIPDFTKITVFYAYIMQYINIALAIFALSLGLSSFLQEENDKTIEFLFAQPISRRQLIIEKLIANILILFTVLSFVVFAGVLSIFIFKPEDAVLLSILKDSIPLFLSYYVMGYIFLLFGSGLSLLLKPGSKVISVSMAVVFSTYFIGIMASLSELLKPLKSLSLLHGLFPSDLYIQSFDVYSVIFWIGLALFTFVYGFIKFSKRDIIV